MPSYPIYTLKSGSRNWLAFFNGEITAQELAIREIVSPTSAEVRAGMGEISRKIVSLLNDTTDGWTERPTFNVETRERIEQLNVKVETTYSVVGAGAENWQRVNDGTPKHYIPKVPKAGKKYLPIRDYVRHTHAGNDLPKSNPSGGYHRAQPVRRAKQVYQGIAPRHFDERIVQFMSGDHDNSFSRLLVNALKRAKRRIEKQ